MKMGKSMLALLLVFVMVLSMFPVVGAAENFEKSRTWSDKLFTDVPKDQWYYETIKEAYELSLMSGDTGGTFRPDGLVTLAETVTVAARIHAIAATGKESFVQGTPWYKVYVDYALQAGILTSELADYSRAATREEFARILAKALPVENLKAINTVEYGAIPDVKDDEDIYLLYRAGILGGNDNKGTFAPKSNIKRSEVAAIVARMALPELRKEFTLTVKKDSQGSSAPIGGQPVQPEQGENVTPEEPETPGDSTPVQTGTDAPFDQQNPDLIANGEVDFSGEQLNLKLKEAPTAEVQQALQNAGVTKLELLFTTSDGIWYIAYITGDVTQVLDAVRQIDAVETAEYDYAYSTQAFLDNVTEMDADVKGNEKLDDQWYLNACGLKKGWGHLKNKHNHGHGPNGDEGDENVGIAGENVVVAVIDTGVDYTHPDLADNIWKNTNEIPDDGKDNDNNGYIDDYYGVDITTGEGSGMDDNGHGTHVAGIIAASNNNTGIVGVAYNAKIMNIKAGQASGYFNNSDIAKAITYAATHGAHVINMSFGGIASSQAVEEALANAFTNCVLVASAGNDDLPNEKSPEWNGDVKPNYPAAYPYVLGVMSVDENGRESDFTNWDVEGFNSVEYEVYAPGYQMLSTIPNGGYAKWSGTSMAAPVVSGIAALLRANYWDTDRYTTRFIYGQLAGTGTQAACLNPEKHGKHNIPKIVDAYEAMTVLPKPAVNASDFMIFDTPGLNGSTVNNGDGIIDAGETIALGFTLQNQWGKSGQSVVTVDAKTQASVDNRVTFLNNDVNYGSVGTYSTGDAGFKKDGDLIIGWENPVYVKIADDCPNDSIITLNVTVTSTNGLDDKDKTAYTEEAEFTLDVRNAVVLPNKFEEDTVLEGGKLYVIPNSTTIFEGVTVTVQPGARIQFWSDDENDAYAQQAITYLKVEGNLILNGTEESPIEIFPGERFSQYQVEIYENNNGRVKMYHTKVTNPYLDITYAEDCEFTQNYRSEQYYYRYLSGGKVSTSYNPTKLSISKAKDCAFDRLGGGKRPGTSTYYDDIGTVSGSYEGCIFVDCALQYSSSGQFDSCVFYGNNTYQGTDKGSVSSMSVAGLDSNSIFGFEDISYPPQIVVHEKTGTTYFAVLARLPESKCIFAVRKFVETLGGTLVCINSQEELEFLQKELKAGQKYILGLQKDSRTGKLTWDDDTEFDGTYPIVENDGWTWAKWNLRENSAIETHEPGIYAGGWYLFELPGDIYVQDIILNTDHLLLGSNKGAQIEATLEPVTAVDVLQYKSLDERIVTVSETGYVTPVAVGETTIVISSSDGVVSVELPVTVTQYVAMEAVELGDDMKLVKGDAHQLNPVLTPAETTERLTYTSSDPAVATVNSDGLIESVAPGTALITASCEENAEICDAITITVVVPAESITAEEQLYVTNAEKEETVDVLGIQISPADTTETALIWESSNPEIVSVGDDGKLIKTGAEGSATLRATVEGTNLYAEVTVLLSDQSSSARVLQVERFTGSGSYLMALLSDGTLWLWGNQIKAPLKLPFEGVAKFDVSLADGYPTLMIVDAQGILNIYRGSYQNPQSLAPDKLYNYPLGGSSVSNVIDVAAFSYGESIYGFYYVQENGAVWGWGANGSGQLGINNTTKYSNAVQMQLPGGVRIVDVEAVSDYTALLTADGDLYYTGYASNNSNTLLPKLYASGVTAITSITGRVQIEYADSIQRGVDGIVTPKLGEKMYSDGNSKWYLQGGIVYASGNNSYGQLGTGSTISVSGNGVAMKKITNAEKLFLLEHNGETVYVQTVDGRFYGVGRNDNCQIPNLIQGNQLVPNRIFFGLEAVSAAPTLTCTNLSDELEQKALTESRLLLDFDQGLQIGGNVSSMMLKDGDGERLAISYEQKLDKLWLQPYGGFESGKTYTLTIPANALANHFNVSAEAVELTFTYTGMETVLEEVSQVSYAAMAASASEELEEVRFTWTAEKIQERWADYLRNGESGVFCGNAVLNRTDYVVDSDPERWLRITGASSTDFALHPIAGNYWGTTDVTLINKQILDYDDYDSLVDLREGACLAEAPEELWPFVTKAWLTNKDGEVVTSVSNEQLTFHVTFNRDMDTTIPLDVRFGSAYPFGDYAVDGAYVDSRTWEGTYALNTFVSGGYQCWSIRNGRAATDPDKELFYDWGRFSFKVDTSTVQAMTMQADVQDTGITLSWYQDDFATLAGYHVYRSETENGTYTRINPTIIPVGTTTFFDDNVKPATTYYYTFKVIKTDLSESQPSNKIRVVSKDTMPPSLIHTAVGYATQNSRLNISATVTDNLQLDNVKLYFRAAGETEWTERTMTALNDKYSAVIEGYELDLAGMEYYIAAYDGVSYAYKGSAAQPYTVTVREASDVAGLGDVDGDGAITMLDAYRVLQAASGNIIITDPEEMKRGDLNGDGQFNSAEALRIVMYINGDVGTLKMES